MGIHALCFQGVDVTVWYEYVTSFRGSKIGNTIAVGGDILKSDLVGRSSPTRPEYLKRRLAQFEHANCLPLDCIFPAGGRTG